MRCKVFVMMVDGEENGHQQGDQYKNYPGAFAKFGGCKQNHDNRRTDRAESIDNHFVLPARLVFECGTWIYDFHAGSEVSRPPPAARHACLRECKREKHTNRIEWNKARDARFEENNQQRSNDRQCYDPVRVDKSASAE